MHRARRSFMRLQRISDPSGASRRRLDETDLALDGRDRRPHLLVAVDQAADLADGAHHRRVVLAAEAIAELGITELQPLPTYVHRDHPREADRAVAAVRLQIAETDVEVLACRALYVL